MVLVDVPAAAAYYHVKPATIRKRISRGQLTRYGRDPQGRTLVDLTEVWRYATRV